MKIAIIGASGFLGTKLRKILSKNHQVIAADINESKNIERLDATNKDEVEKFLLKIKPEIVIDTVALTSSVACEKNPELAEKLNYSTAKNIADACKKINAKMVFMSSSYVFDGKKGNYNEEDKPTPTNEYARTKLMAEEVSKLKNFLILRVDIMYGLDENKIKFGTRTFEKGVVEVGYPNQIKNPIFIDDVPKIILELIQKNEKGIFHLAGPDRFTMLDFLRKLASMINKESSVVVVDSSGWLVKSPHDSSLDTSKINSLGIKTTSFEQALRIIRNQLSQN